MKPARHRTVIAREGEAVVPLRRQNRKEVATGSLTNETEYGDASACLCLSHPVDPTRPAALTSNGVPVPSAMKPRGDRWLSGAIAR